ncbi:MAG TPA: hypothetical protein VF252_08660 [Gemmatimonadales bacterium]
MKWLRRFRVLGLTLLLLTGVSCATSDGSLTGADEQSAPQAAPLLGDLGGVVDDLTGTLGVALGGVLEVTDLLTCTEQKYVAVSQTVGPNGGKITVGEHTLVIPEGALSGKTVITAEQMPGSSNSVRFSPEGLQFEKPAVLTMSYQNCLVVLLPKTIVYTTEKFKILEVLRSLDLFRQKRVAAPIDHFSRYVVAY